MALVFMEVLMNVRGELQFFVIITMTMQGKCHLGSIPIVVYFTLLQSIVGDFSFSPQLDQLVQPRKVSGDCEMIDDNGR